MPRVISLDLDDTLWPVMPVLAAAEVALLSWLRAHYPRAVNGHDLDSMRALRARIAARYPLQRHDLSFVRRRALTEQFAAAGHGEESVSRAMEVFFAERNRVECYLDVRPALARWRADYRLFGLSNGNADLTRCGLGGWFEGHVTAAMAGAAKPDGRIFAALTRMAGVEPIEILHIGDDPLADVVGATRAGMQAVWLNRDGRAWPAQFAPPPRTVSTLEQIF